MLRYGCVRYEKRTKVHVGEKGRRGCSNASPVDRGGGRRESGMYDLRRRNGHLSVVWDSSVSRSETPDPGAFNALVSMFLMHGKLNDLRAWFFWALALDVAAPSRIWTS